MRGLHGLDEAAWVLVEGSRLLLHPLVLIVARLDVPEGHLAVLERRGAHLEVVKIRRLPVEGRMVAHRHACQQLDLIQKTLRS